MAKNYTELSAETLDTNMSTNSSEQSQAARGRLLDLIMERVENGSNIDYIVKLSEVYRNIK